MKLPLFLCALALTCAPFAASAQAPTEAVRLAPMDATLKAYAYPHEVRFLPVVVEAKGKRVQTKLAYMDVAPTSLANGRTVLLLHGRNFPAGYWGGTIKALTAAGYRVIAPDQINFGKSGRVDDMAVRFDVMADHTWALLDHLKIEKVDVVAHSMGNVAGTRLVLAHPERAGRLVMYAPIGLQDYRPLTPPIDPEALVRAESAKGAEAYRKELVGSYGLASPVVIEPFVTLREQLKAGDEWPFYVRTFNASAVAIRDLPVVQDIPRIPVKTLFLVGSTDRAAPGKAQASEADKAKFKTVAELAAEIAPTLPDARVRVFDGRGHLIHLEDPEAFNQAVLDFLAQ
ncbi:alpha/beta hydrolase [Caulobacter segnis]|uniref:alpha/beta fold hydrolase n=1 Tax=Caulobacter segnis TaxID=88688 RepID=UPI0024100742|nr:alpha/beta hydrolase [Caulobacter segnis]MDG2520910.1 alpha/beta hydrolase [Caulobacter segnis]